MASIKRNGWKPAAEAAQMEVEWARAETQARNYMSRIM